MLYILLPVFNEEAHIEQLLSAISSALSDTPHQIVIVNDGSTDKTLKILSGLSAPNVTVLSHNINLSIGAVYCTGINYVVQHGQENDALVLMESDLTSPASMIKSLQLELLAHDKDIVIASRYLNKGGYRNFPLTRTSLSLGANFFMRFFFPIEGVRDYTIFLRAYRISILAKVFSFFGSTNCLQSKGFVSNAELLIKCSLFTKKIGEIPFIYNYATKKNPSKMRILGTILEYFSFVFFMHEIIKKFNVRMHKTATA